MFFRNVFQISFEINHLSVTLPMTFVNYFLLIITWTLVSSYLELKSKTPRQNEFKYLNNTKYKNWHN